MIPQKIKIALVKQEVYQDLYVCPTSEKDNAEILFSSQGRVGPMGLMSEFNADFYIVKEEYSKECQTYKKIIPHIANHLQLLKTQTLDKIPGQEFKVPGSSFPNGHFAIDCHTVDWAQYDIVISINVSLPTKLIAKYKNTLFAYMIGEANLATNKALFGYDVTLNQLASGNIDKINKIVDFPYTYLNGKTLQDILSKYLNRPSKNKGVFMEINSTTERPVTEVPLHFKPLEEMGQKIQLHQQKIKDNLITIYDSKYFVKMGGRFIRGNSLVEAISLGTLAIMNRDECHHKELVIDQCNVKTMDDVVALISRLEKDDNLYQTLLNEQQDIVANLFFEIPMQYLIQLLNEKKANPRSASSICFSNNIYFLKDKLYKLKQKVKTKLLK